MAAHPGADATTFAPFVVHPLAPLNFDAQIPKKGDQRQMEDWQRIGVYAAGLALDSAGVKGKSRHPLAHGHDRRRRRRRARPQCRRGDPERDAAAPPNPAAFLNERLMSDLRPTLFLAQLSNLLAGNISIVHGVTGSSRTFMGEESAGVDAVRIALARIAAGQSEIALVGGSYNGERPDLLMLYEFDRLRAERALRAGVGARRTRRRRASARSAPFWCSKRASMRRRAAQSRWRGCPTVLSERCQARARRRHRRACRDVGQDQGQGHARASRGAVGRQRRRARDHRRARLSRRPSRACRARHRVLSRAWGGAAIRHECRAGRRRARAC